MLYLAYKFFKVSTDISFFKKIFTEIGVSVFTKKKKKNWVYNISGLILKTIFKNKICALSKNCEEYYSHIVIFKKCVPKDHRLIYLNILNDNGDD